MLLADLRTKTSGSDEITQWQWTGFLLRGRRHSVALAVGYGTLQRYIGHRGVQRSRIGHRPDGYAVVEPTGEFEGAQEVLGAAIGGLEKPAGWDGSRLYRIRDAFGQWQPRKDN